MGATSNATLQYFESHRLETDPVLFGKTGWSISPVGFGGYRTQNDNAQHRTALREALLRGCNLVDTSANYMNGASEKLIGETLGELIGEGRLQREQIVVVSKAGYVQGSNLKRARERAAGGIPFAEMTEFSDSCWHCISPEFLEDQITRSLQRLQLDQLDVLLLHNPEYFLKVTGDHAEYYRRIEAAFDHLEKEVKAGRIQWYGVSSNTFPDPKDSHDYTSLEAVTEIAEKFGENHHFAVIQFPFNLFEPGAAFEENNSGRTLLEYARAKKLGTLTNRPLNAYHREKLVRLAEFPAHEQKDIVGDFKESMTRATALEARYPSLFEGKPPVAANRIAWGHILRENVVQLSDLDVWRNILRVQIQPTLQAALEELSGLSACRSWVDEYRTASAQLFEDYTAYLESQASAQSDQIAGKLDHLGAALQTSPTLSQKVIRLYRSIPGIDCILVGMRQTDYVLDVMNLKAPLGSEPARHALLEFSNQQTF